MFCGSCGNQIPEGASFCPECGWRVPEELRPSEQVGEQAVAAADSSMDAPVFQGGMTAATPAAGASPAAAEVPGSGPVPTTGPAPAPGSGSASAAGSASAPGYGATPATPGSGTAPAAGYGPAPATPGSGPAPSAGPAPAAGAYAFCPECGTPLTAQSEFCPHCGWRVGSPVKKRAATRAAESFAGAVNKITGNADRINLAFKDFFVAVPHHHKHVEAERLLTVGTPETTPPITSVSEDWPRPWVYSRVFLVLLVTLVLDVVFVLFFGNRNGIPTIMFLGAALMPVTTLIFFFETNVPQNISFATTLEILFVGGIVSILAIHLNPLLGYSGAGFMQVVPALLTGLIEELAKALTVAFFLSRMKDKRYILNGLLVGAAVGAGFAMFESAGYAFNQFMDAFWNELVTGDTFSNLAAGSISEEYALYQLTIAAVPGAINSVVVRAITAIGGHVAWAAAEGGALALCYDGGSFKWRKLFDKRFLGIFVICVILHGLWDSMPLLQLTWVICIVAIWIVLDVLLQRGLVQVDELNGDGPNAPKAAPDASQSQGA